MVTSRQFKSALIAALIFAASAYPTGDYLPARTSLVNRAATGAENVQDVRFADYGGDDR